jgi:hypothetical protein
MEWILTSAFSPFLPVWDYELHEVPRPDFPQEPPAVAEARRRPAGRLDRARVLRSAS